MEDRASYTQRGPTRINSLYNGILTLYYKKHKKYPEELIVN